MMKQGVISNLIAGATLVTVLLGVPIGYVVKKNHAQDLEIASKVGDKSFTEFVKSQDKAHAAINFIQTEQSVDIGIIKTNIGTMKDDIHEIKQLLKEE